MIELISRADAIEAVCGDCSIETKNNCKEEGYCYEVRNLKALPSAEAEWIPCSERLPSNNDCVLVTVDDSIEFGKYEAEEWNIWYDQHWDKWCANVLAWMPLPKPYREDGEA